jgi:hypothetical protein
MWYRSGDAWRLAPHENLLKKWLPILSEEETFSFRRDVEVRWSHEWPDSQNVDHQVLFFVRDPRDSLFSRFRREAESGKYADFLTSPDHLTLLSRPENWSLFCDSWLTRKDVSIFRFEDYKSDAEGTLSSVVAALGLKVTPDQISDAAERSTFERAANAERLYRLANPADEQRINRAGAVGSWGGEGVDAAALTAIEEGAGHVMEALGYKLSTGVALRRTSYRPNIDELPFFRSVRLPRQVVGDNADSREERRRRLAWLAEFGERLSIHDLRKSGYTLSECKLLLDGLIVLLEKDRADVRTRLRGLREAHFPQAAAKPQRKQLMKALLNKMRWVQAK